ncbi:AraC family transcriptional regulator [Paraglaciecola aquimarina]|uniref:AraC family transcriptional regulator n=1 Tax=Paraglaciecola aquimarina TaxID=1235557 RepID=A0ABU3SS13_9ALTE|nr:AraC family transcriptional regulator [Paraglaciecola aquimarina]MDU0352767.1 AraC family transcriptional regulator [Paraglaciecola aquimarina]
MNSHIHKNQSEGFPHQRLVILQPAVIQTCKQLAVVNTLFVTHIGSFPSAPAHRVERPQGCIQSILIYCIKGTGWLKINNIKWQIEPGQIILIPAGIEHAYGSNDAQPWSIFWVHFAGVESLPILRSIVRENNRYLVNVSGTTQIKQAFEQLYACIDHHYSDAGLILMSAKLLHLLGLIKLNQRMLPFGGNTEKCTSSMIRDSISYMEQHLHTTLTINELAKRAEVSVPHYCKSFKQVTNRSPVAYFTRLKVRKACDYLYQSTLTVKAIGELLAYTDPYYFSRVFKKFQGCSPENYRKNLVKEGLKNTH